MGDRDWARTHLREALRDGAYSASTRAIAAYRRMVDQWKGGDARALETVERFRARIAALEG